MDEKQRSQIFYEDLSELLKGKYINKEEYEKVNFKYSIYCKNRKILRQLEVKPQIITETINIPVKIQPKVSSPNNIKRPASIQVKKQLSQQEIRDKNITLVLIIGVILVLLSGLVLATSNWNILSNHLKTTLIVLVSVMFFAMSILTDKALKIEKTAFAFWVLGSLFLPVAILSGGFFKLFGEWLSVTGDGRYVLGVIGAIICVPIYLYSAERNKNRFFVWISYITINIGVYNLVAAFRLNIDMFFFIIVIYNSLVMLSYAKLKTLDKYKLFTKELFSFSQVNLVISTIFIFTIYHNYQLYGVNIILLSLLYIGMVYLEDKKEYIYVFSGLITYGIYQIIEHSHTGFLELLLLSAIGIIFIGLERYKNTEDKLKILYKYLNGLITTFTFFYITIKALMISENYPIILLVIAYLIISLNFIYLSYTSSKKIFNYTAPVFLAITGLQLCRLIQNLVLINITSLSIFSVSLLLFFLIYFKNYSKYLNNMKNSSGVVSCILIGISVLFSFYNKQWFLSSLVLYFSSYLLYLINSNCRNKYIIIITKWNMPLNVLMGTCVFFGEISKIFIYSWYDFFYHFGVSVLVLLLISFCFKKINNTIENSFFIVFHIFMPFSILSLIIRHYDNPLIFLIATLIYLYSTLSEKKESLKRTFLYGGLLASSLILPSMLVVLKLDQGLKYVMLIMTVFMAILWYLSNIQWRKRITPFILIYSILGGLIFNVNVLLEIKGFFLALIYIIIILFIMHKEKLKYLIFLPLFLLVEAISILGNPIFSLLIFIILRIMGQLLYKGLYEKVSDNSSNIKNIDWYSIFALFTVLITFSNSYGSLTKWFHFVVFVSLSGLIYSQINRVEKGIPKKIILTLFIMSTVLPYYKLIDNLQVPSIISTELNLLPWIVIITIFYRKVWKDTDKEIGIVNIINNIIIVVSALILLKGVAIDNFLVDRLILGVTSLFAIYIGMLSRVKVYFFAGIITLILNILIQTKELWSNIPWWGYLLISGLILIGMASLNEVQKNKDKKNKIDMENIKNKFKDWK